MDRLSLDRNFCVVSASAGAASLYLNGYSPKVPSSDQDRSIFFIGAGPFKKCSTQRSSPCCSFPHLGFGNGMENGKFGKPRHVAVDCIMITAC